jgi:hypothetical protein
VEQDPLPVDGSSARRQLARARALVGLVALLAVAAGCGSTTLVAAPKFEDHDLVRLFLLDDARQTERQCVAANGVRSAEGCMAAYLRQDGAIATVAWLTRSMPVEEYRRALPLWCESLAIVQGLPPDRCGRRTVEAETAVSAQPGIARRPVITIPVGPVQSGHLLTLVLGGSAGVEKSENPVIRVRADVPTGSPDAKAWTVVAQEWCHSIAHAEWQLVQKDPCHGGADEIRVNIMPVDVPLGWRPLKVPCVGWVNQFCDPVVLPRR